MAYHINPETGNPGVCRAKKKCRFGGDSSHYDSKEQAQEAYEKEAQVSLLYFLRKDKLSKGAKLLLELDRAQNSIARRIQEAEAADNEEWLWTDPDFSDRITERNALSQRVEKTLTWDHSDEPTYDDSVTVPFQTLGYSGTEDRHGYNKDSFTPSPPAAIMYEQLDLASAEWIRRLSTAEIKAVVTYNLDAKAYAKLTAEAKDAEADDEFVKYFHSAMAKAPLTERPFKVYAGVSEQRIHSVREQAEKGALELNRIQSASANPAQVNQFMQRDGLNKDGKETALEFELDRVASLSAFNVHKDEMEILVPPGEYAVSEKLHGINYYWGEKDGSRRDFGRTSDITYVVTKKED